MHSLVELSGWALATSGDYRNYFEVDGIRYSHTLDPRTGRPVTHQLASVSVLAERALDADAWATALNVLGPNQGLELAEKRGVAALFLIYDGDTSGTDPGRAPGVSERSTTKWRELLATASAAPVHEKTS